MITYEEEMKNRRNYVKFSLEDTWARRQLWEDKETNLEPFAQQPFFNTIWDMSTRILPNLEVQVVIDDNDNCFVSSGSSGFVSFMHNPVGMKLPIKCWIHTHPFGRAYFSGTDWNTVNTWQKNMKEAYVLGGYEHFGFWQNTDPDVLVIQESNLGEQYSQYQDEKKNNIYGCSCWIDSGIPPVEWICENCQEEEE